MSVIVVWAIAAAVLFVASTVMFVLAHREMKECLRILDRAKDLHAEARALVGRWVA